MLLDALLIAVIAGLLAVIRAQHRKVRELRRIVKKASRFLDF